MLRENHNNKKINVCQLHNNLERVIKTGRSVGPSVIGQVANQQPIVMKHELQDIEDGNDLILGDEQRQRCSTSGGEAI